MSNVEERLKKLVSYPSTTDNQAVVSELLDDIQGQLSSTPLHMKRFVNNGVHSLVATSRDTKQPTLWLVSHVDVVGGSPELFTMKTEGDILIGRGVVDDKFAAAAFIEAIMQLGDTIDQYNFGVMLTGDEETSGVDGARYLIEDEGYRGEVAFIPDSGLGWQIETQAKGSIRFLIKAHGESAHGSRPWLGDNAIEKLLKAIEITRDTLELPPLREAKDGYVRTMNLGTIKGGEAANQVPDYAEAQIDIRFIYPFEAEEIRIKVPEALRQLSGVSVEESSYVAPVFTDPNDPWIQKFITILESEGITPGFSRSFGGTDARFFAEQGMSVLVSMPPGGNLHSDGEWIERRGLEQLVTITKKLIQKT